MTTRKSKITITLVQALIAGETVFDTEVAAFGVRRQVGPASYFVKTRVAGRQKWVTIGKHGSPWLPETARREARKILTEAADGVDRTLSKVAAATPATSFTQVADDFKTLYGPKLKPRTLEEYTGLIERYLKPAFGNRPIADLVRADITTAHAKWAEHPRAANHALAVMSKIMSWAEEHGYRPDRSNPCFKIKKYREVKRQRYLSLEELARLGQAIQGAEQGDLISPAAAAALRLLLLTGARLGELLTLRWSFVDMQRGLLILPDSKTGQKTIALNDAAIVLLKRIPRVDHNPFVIVGHRIGSSMVDLFKPWSVVRTRAKLDDIRIHDLRHTFASVAVANGGSLPVIGKMLGHREVQTTARYAHLADDPVRKLTEVTGRAIADALAVKADAKAEGPTADGDGPTG